jgi:hypothetical protein
MELINILSQTNFKSKGTGLLLAGILAGGVLVSSVSAQTAAPAQPAQPAAKPAAALKPYRNQPDHIAPREAAYYEAVWGIGEPTVKAVESGIILKFSYKVLDAQKATPLNDKKVDPILVSPEKGLKLVIPTMDKVGQLRQAPPAIEAGKSYWMAFSNNGRQLKPGDRVDVVIGNFHARGLLIE